MGAAVKDFGGKGKALLGKPPKHRPKSPIDKARGDEVIWPSVAPVFEATRRILGPSFVYFIGEQDGGPVKIGVAKDPIGRLRNMQTGNPRHTCVIPV